MTTIQTSNAPAAIGPYTQGKVVNGFVFTSGQIGLVPATGELAGSSIEEQTEQAIANLKAILEVGGTDITKVIKTTCFLAEIADFAAFNAVYAKHFTGGPARSCFAVKDLPKGALCEIEAIAEA